MKFIVGLFIIFTSFATCAQSGTWTWVRGSAGLFAAGSYGIKGVATPTNEPSGRYEPAYWKDLDGNFWIFGGNNGAGVVNDLWKYDPIANNWTWMNGPQANTNPAGSYGVQGIPSSQNYPQGLGYGSLNWTDENGDLWLYGGVSFLNQMDELWRYHIATNEWTWMKGTLSNTVPIAGTLGQFAVANTPGAIAECKSAWVYDHKLWFYGGQDLTGQTYAALWCYDISSNNWALQSGSVIPYTPGSYGTLGVSSATNMPPAKVSYTNWKDSADNFYIFAGDPTFSSGNIGTNDVWRYSTSTHEWTWIDGSATVNDVGSGTSYCHQDSSDIPRARIENMTVKSTSKCSNACWTFGGFNTGGHDFHNDLWLFNPDKNVWTLVKGTTSTGGFGTFLPYNYGVLGVADTGNIPPGRGGGAIWSDNTGAIWVFGGFVLQASDAGFMNDLWKFEPDTSCFHLDIQGYEFHAPPKDIVLCEGDSFSINIPFNLNVQVNPTNDMTVDTLHHIIIFHAVQAINYSILASSIDQSSPCRYKDSFNMAIHLVQKPIANFMVSPLSTPLSQPTFTLTNTSSFATSFTWYDSVWNVIGTDSIITQTFTQPGTYCFTLIAANDCNEYDTVIKCGVIESEPIEIYNGVIVPNAFSPNDDHLNDVFTPIFSSGYKLMYLNIYNRWGNLVYRTTNIQEGWNGKYKGQNSSSDVYFYLIECTDPFGKNKKLRGDVTLIR